MQLDQSITCKKLLLNKSNYYQSNYLPVVYYHLHHRYEIENELCLRLTYCPTVRDLLLILMSK